MIYAPVLIPTLCRYEHFKNCIESLKKNEFAKETDVYIGLDYPTKKSHWEGYNKIKYYLESGITGFKNIIVFVREYNYGASLNLEELQKSAFQKYDRVIVSEDDNVFSRNYLEYIDKMFELTEDNQQILYICGYSYPVKWKNNGYNVVKEQLFFSAWGYGELKKNFDIMNKKYNIDYLNQILHDNKRLRTVFKRSKKNFCYLINLISNQDTRPHDIAKSIFMLLEDKYCLMPVVSKVRNCGWDGSGINCNEMNQVDYMNQTIDSAISFDLDTDSVENIISYVENEDALNLLYPAPYNNLIRSVVKLMLMKIFGITLYQKIFKAL